MTTTFEAMKRIIVKDYELAPERLAPETPLAEIELDSLAVTELIFSLEDEFNVTAKTNGQGLQTLGEIAAYIDRLIAERDAPAARTGA
jgi:acyl carrier protein